MFTRSRKKRLGKSQLYVILDKKISGKIPLSGLLKLIKRSAVDIIQLRDKDSQKKDCLKNAFLARRLLSGTRKIFIVNDYLDIAKIVDSDGIHLGQSDTSVNIARRILGKDKIIGISCHSLKQALRAQRQGADYLSIGPVFPTATKPEAFPLGLEAIKNIARKINIPFFVIGGINRNNLKEICALGCKRVAVCRAIIKAQSILGSSEELKMGLVS